MKTASKQNKNPLLHIPVAWQDYRNPSASLPVNYGGADSVVLSLIPFEQPRISFSPGKPPVTSFGCYLSGGNSQMVTCSAYGLDEESAAVVARAYQSSRILIVSGKLKRSGDRFYLNSIVLIPPVLVGRVVPLYRKAPMGMDATEFYCWLTSNEERLIEEVDQEFEAAAAAAGYSAQNVMDAAGVKTSKSFGSIARCMHFPDSPEQAEAAASVVRRVAHALLLLEAPKRPVAASKTGFSLPDEAQVVSQLKELTGLLPHTPTPEQKRATWDIAKRMIGASTPIHHLVLGDVGTGKTTVLLLIAALTRRNGGSAALMLPTELLAEQMYKTFASTLGEADLVLVTGRSKCKPSDRPTIYIGTTGLLWLGAQLDLVIVDEQQRFGKDQREKLYRGGAHFIEATATLIPRSMAFLRYGAVTVSKLTQGHAKKEICTNIYKATERQSLFARVRETVEAGDRVLVVYPRKTVKEGLHSVKQAFAVWNEKFPGLVRQADSDTDQEDQRQAMDDMIQGRAQILISTTVIETGVNIPRCRRIVIVEASRFGLSTLHQLRGRLAREGGHGACDLYLPTEVKQETIDRLRFFSSTNDGFAIADYDLGSRGVGDLFGSGSEQSGASAQFLIPNEKVSIQVLDAMSRRLQCLFGHTANAV